MKTIRLLFNDQMARAIVEGRKTVTRRPVMPGTWSPNSPEYTGESTILTNSDPRIGTQAYFKTAGAEWHGIKPPCTPGDLLIGRECFAYVDPEHGGGFTYRADYGPSGPGAYGLPRRRGTENEWFDGKWSPSIHMPDWAARIRRRVVSVTVERVQDITEEDAVREGFPAGLWGKRDTRACGEFSATWDDIYAARGLGWFKNPWVWRIEFGAENVGVDTERGGLTAAKVMLNGR